MHVLRRTVHALRRWWGRLTYSTTDPTCSIDHDPVRPIP